eukprot:scaffold335683_cov51-Attheya_sp.AAC.1
MTHKETTRSTLRSLKIGRVFFEEKDVFDRYDIVSSVPVEPASPSQPSTVVGAAGASADSAKRVSCLNTRR